MGGCVCDAVLHESAGRNPGIFFGDYILYTPGDEGRHSILVEAFRGSFKGCVQPQVTLTLTPDAWHLTAVYFASLSLNVGLVRRGGMASRYWDGYSR